MKLGDAQIEVLLTEHPEWRLEEKRIVRRYKFGSFLEAIAFVNGVAEIAERMDHHPFISVDFKFVTLTLTSWHAGGLTERDFEEAKACDALYTSLSI